MGGLPSASPEHSVTPKDIGAETASRYRFQYVCAAILCCALFEDTEDVEEVYCEHYEDVLTRHTDGTFSGYQVKTRAANRPAWRTRDPGIWGALQDFVRLEHENPGSFRSFRLHTNHYFYVRKAATSLPYILEQIHRGEVVDQLAQPIQKVLSDLSAATGVCENVAFRTLKKTTASCDLPKLRDAMIRLIQTLTECWDGALDCTHEVVQKAAQGLVDECARASTLDHRQFPRAYVTAILHPTPDRLARIEGKRMSVARVERALRDGMTSTAPLVGLPAGELGLGEGRTDLLRIKLDAGGFSIVSCNSAEDLRIKADYLAFASINRLGEAVGLRRYEHMRSLVLSDASRALELVKRKDVKFGPAMRELLRSRFEDRRAKGESLYDYSDEHMEGLAYSLTAQCEVQWSVEQPWEAK